MGAAPRNLRVAFLNENLAPADIRDWMHASPRYPVTRPALSFLLLLAVTAGGLSVIELGCGASPGGDGPMATGGTTMTGGRGATGGAPDSGTGGAGATGGAPSGGASTGGSSPRTGGTSMAAGARGGRTGGSAEGGAGGRATGGATSVAGAGGTGTGGTSTGGAGALPAGLSGLFPPPGASQVCPDPVLRLTFPRAPTLGSSGRIEVANATGTVVATVDLAASTFVDKVGSVSLTKERPVYLEGPAVVVVLPHAALSYGQTYTVTVAAGAVKPADGSSFSLSASSGWRFTTASAAPRDLSALAVALDGSGQFCTVQGALDAIPSSNATTSRISIAPGTYHEVILAKSKSNVTLHGLDRKGTIIAGTNNEKMNSGTATRALVGFDGAVGLVVENLTIRNLTPQGGSQAEALRLQTCDKCVVQNADILSLQDTLLWSGRIYAKGCYIAGNVDYVWGTGAVYFDQCEIHTTGRNGYNVQARNDAGKSGYAFVDCKLTADAGISGDILARIDVSEYPGSQVAYVNCQLGAHIAPAGWTITGGSAGSALRFWEYQSHDAAGNPIDVSKRLAGSRQISASEAMSLRDTATFFGGWKP